MPLKQISPEFTRHVNLRWTRPMPYEQLIERGSRHDADGWLYMILGYSGSSQPELFYIGKVCRNHVSARLRQHDHKRRYTRLCDENRDYKFRVSIGAIEIEGGRTTEKRVDQIETLLIYTAKETQPLINERKWLTHRISAAYHIRNCGYRRPLPREIRLGIFSL